MIAVNKTYKSSKQQFENDMKALKDTEHLSEEKEDETIDAQKNQNGNTNANSYKNDENLTKKVN